MWLQLMLTVFAFITIANSHSSSYNHPSALGIVASKNIKRGISLIINDIPTQLDMQTSLLINGKYLFKFNTNLSINTVHINNIPTNNRYVIACYQHLNHKNNTLNLIAINSINVNQHTIVAVNKYCDHSIGCIEIDYAIDKIQLDSPRISTYYSVWETWVGQAWQNITYNMKQLNMNGNFAPNVETLLRSNETITMYDLLQQWKWTMNSTNSSIKLVSANDIAWYYWQQRPDPLGYYCIYQDNNHRNILPNCTNISDTLLEHAHMLTSSGVDFIVVDLTNDVNGMDDYWAYSFQIQPTQTLYEFWSKFRKNNTNTPDIVVWNPANGVEWRDYLDIYNSYGDMVYQYNGKMIYFVMSHQQINDTVVDLIESNDNLNNVQVLKMWVAANETLYKTGQWTYMSPCRENSTNYLYETTSVEALDTCNLKYTTNSFLGSQVATSFNYETWSKASYTSLPFGSPTKLNGRTLKLTVGDALKIKPDNILFPSFNEHQCSIQNMSNMYGGNNTWSVGLGYDTNGRNVKFMDQYGSERSRAFEPTYESGDYYYRLFQSCIRVMKLSMFYNLDHYTDSHNKICNIDGEICCNPMEEFVDIYSLKNNKTNDFVVSNNKSEVIDLVNNENYDEICVPDIFGNSSVFCENNDNLYSYDQHRGPFILYKNFTSFDGAFPYVNIKRIALYRCEDSNNKHFISNDINQCTQNERILLLGYGAMSKSSAMARKLVRCQNTGNIKYYYHVVDDNCLQNDIHSQVLAYVL